MSPLPETATWAELGFDHPDDYDEACARMAREDAEDWWADHWIDAAKEDL